MNVNSSGKVLGEVFRVNWQTAVFCGLLWDGEEKAIDQIDTLSSYTCT